MSQDRVYPANAPIGELSTAELFVISAVRLWVAPLRDPLSIHPDWQRSFVVAGIGEDGAPEFDRLFQIVRSSAQRNLDVRCASCPHLGEDEAALLRLISLLQCGRSQQAAAILAEWLP